MSQPIPGEIWWIPNALLQVTDTPTVYEHPAVVVSTNGISVKVLPGSSRPDTFRQDGYPVDPKDVVLAGRDSGLNRMTYFSRAPKRVVTQDLSQFRGRIGTVTASKLADLKAHCAIPPTHLPGTKP